MRDWHAYTVRRFGGLRLVSYDFLEREKEISYGEVERANLKERRAAISSHIGAKKRGLATARLVEFSFHEVLCALALTQRNKSYFR